MSRSLFLPIIGLFVFAGCAAVALAAEQRARSLPVTSVPLRLAAPSLSAFLADYADRLWNETYRVDARGWIRID